MAQAAAHRAPATKVITRTVPRASRTVIRDQSAPGSTYPASGAAVGSCGGISVNSQTSCPFAQNVVAQYTQEAQEVGSPGSFDVYAYGPVTGQSYADTCTYSSSTGTVSCSHGSELIQFAHGSR